MITIFPIVPDQDCKLTCILISYKRYKSNETNDH